MSYNYKHIVNIKKKIGIIICIPPDINTMVSLQSDVALFLYESTKFPVPLSGCLLETVQVFFKLAN